MTLSSSGPSTCSSSKMLKSFLESSRASLTKLEKKWPWEPWCAFESGWTPLLTPRLWIQSGECQVYATELESSRFKFYLCESRRRPILSANVRQWVH